MKKYNTLAIFFDVCAIVLFLAGIIVSSVSAKTSLGLVFIPVGFAFLSAGMYLGRKVQEAQEQNKK